MHVCEVVCEAQSVMAIPGSLRASGTRPDQCVVAHGKLDVMWSCIGWGRDMHVCEAVCEVRSVMATPYWPAAS